MATTERPSAGTKVAVKEMSWDPITRRRSTPNGMDPQTVLRLLEKAAGVVLRKLQSDEAYEPAGAS